METDAFVEDALTNKHCCADTACAVKIYRHFKRLSTEGGIAASKESLRRATVQADTVTDKGGSESTSIEIIFSICRMIGLRPRLALRLL